MNPLRLEADGTLWLRDQALADDVIACLGHPLKLSAACTLRSFFRLLDREKGLQRLNCFAPSFLARYHQSPDHACLFPGIAHLQLTRIIEMTGFPGTPAIRIFVNLEGVGTDGAPQPIKAAGIEQLLEIPLRLGRLKHIVFGDRIDTLEFDTLFNLFEFIDGICWELSFHNLPDQCRLRT